MAKPLDVLSKPVAFGARQAINLTQLAFKGGATAVSAITGGGEQSPPSAAPPRQEQQRAPRRRSSSKPKPLDDVSITRKVETQIFRDSKVPKGKIDVNTADGVVWLRGEAKNPEMVKALEAKAVAIPEVKRVENLLHLPKTPAPSRTDSPPAQRRTRRTKASQPSRAVTPRRVSAERSTSSVAAEPKPKELAQQKRGRQPAPLGSAEKTGASSSPAAAPSTPPKAAPISSAAPTASAKQEAPAKAAPSGKADGPSGPAKLEGSGPAGSGAAKKETPPKAAPSGKADGPSGPAKPGGSRPAAEDSATPTDATVASGATETKAEPVAANGKPEEK